MEIMEAEVAVAWKSEFEVGLKVIDDQHRRLFDTVSELDAMVKKGIASGPEVEKALAFLGSYATTHFVFEEKCMSDYNCPAADKNRAAHSDFLEFFAEFKEGFDRSEDPLPQLSALVSYLTSWLESHICNLDAHLKKCVSADAR